MNQLRIKKPSGMPADTISAYTAAFGRSLPFWQGVSDNLKAGLTLIGSPVDWGLVNYADHAPKEPLTGTVQGEGMSWMPLSEMYSFVPDALLPNKKVYVKLTFRMSHWRQTTGTAVRVTPGVSYSIGRTQAEAQSDLYRLSVGATNIKSGIASEIETDVLVISGSGGVIETSSITPSSWYAGSFWVLGDPSTGRPSQDLFFIGGGQSLGRCTELTHPNGTVSMSAYGPTFFVLSENGAKTDVAVNHLWQGASVVTNPGGTEVMLAGPYVYGGGRMWTMAFSNTLAMMMPVVMGRGGARQEVGDQSYLCYDDLIFPNAFGSTPAGQPTLVWVRDD